MQFNNLRDISVEDDYDNDLSPKSPYYYRYYKRYELFIYYETKLSADKLIKQS
jgi:hypothetical protein